MDFSRLITRRQSVRKYADRQVPEELLEHLVEAVRLSPSASNSQPWRLILVTEPALKDRDFPLIDIGIAAAHFCLQATDLGLGTCMLGWFDEPRIREMLHIPADRRIGLVITLGYAAEGQIRPKQRKSASLMCSRNSY